MLKTIVYRLSNLPWGKLVWGSWFGVAGLGLLTGWDGFLQGAKWMVVLFAGIIVVALSLMTLFAVWEALALLYWWLTTTKEQREQGKAARKTRRIDAPFDHWEPPTGRD